jgi:hypothetical protein
MNSALEANVVVLVSVPALPYEYVEETLPGVRRQSAVSSWPLWHSPSPEPAAKHHMFRQSALVLASIVSQARDSMRDTKECYNLQHHMLLSSAACQR